MKEGGYESVFIGTGAGLPSFMNIPGENYIGVCSANEYLTRINLMKAYLPEYDTPIMHGDKIAMSAAATWRWTRQDARNVWALLVYIIYRRSLAEELPARARKYITRWRGIIFKLLNNPVQILGDETGHVRDHRMCGNGTRRAGCLRQKKPIVKEGSNFEIPVDMVIMSIGTKLNTLILDTTDHLRQIRKAVSAQTAAQRPTAKASSQAATRLPVQQRSSKAMGAGKTAAASIDAYLSGK